MLRAFDLMALQVRLRERALLHGSIQSCIDDAASRPLRLRSNAAGKGLQSFGILLGRIQRCR